MKNINVLIVDDSAVIRSVLTEILDSDPQVSVIGTAPDAYIARNKIKKLNPDVITLDIEMPKMNGLTFLKNIMRLRPMPVVMISTVTEVGALATLQALEIGAVDYVSKSKLTMGNSLFDQAEEIINKVKVAAQANVKPLENICLHSDTTHIRNLDKLTYKTNSVCAIGASTGGTEAIKILLMHLPSNMPPIVMAQHIPKAFSGSFAARLDSSCTITVYEAKDGQPLERGCAYLAPGDEHLSIVKGTNSFLCCLSKSEPVNRHRPSVDILFDSVAKVVGKKSAGVILTGMGRDGAKGLLNMKACGAATFAQDAESSVVWGMPGAAVELDAADKILPINRIPREVIKAMSL